MDVDSLVLTDREPESRQETPTTRSSSNEASSAEATIVPPPSYLTRHALRALGEDGGLVQAYVGPRILLFRGSKVFDGNRGMCCPVDVTSAPGEAMIAGTSATPPVDSDYIFSDINPECHSLIVQQNFDRSQVRTFIYRRPTEDVVQKVKAMIAQALHTSGQFGQECFRMQATKRKRKQQLLDKKGGSFEQPNEEMPSTNDGPTPPVQINNPPLVVTKTGIIKLRTRKRCAIEEPDINKLMELARQKEDDCPLGVVFDEWKLNTTPLSALPLVPSLNSHLPWFYIANPSSSQAHIFGNIVTHQSFLIANSDLQSSYRLLHSKDGWLLLRGIKMDLSSCQKFPRYPVFLLNPTTGARIDLPSLYFQHGFTAICMTAQGTPGVILYVHLWGYTVSIYTIRPGDTYWEEHPYVFKDDDPGTMEKIVLCGDSVYCFFIGSPYSLIFKLANFSWHLVTGEFSDCSLNCYEPFDVDGEVVLVGHPDRCPTPPFVWESVPFLRMEISEDKLKWVKITGDDKMLNGRIWFIHNLQSFCVKVAGSGQKICWFAKIGLSERGLYYGCASALHCLNLSTQAHCRLTADWVICDQCAWVDLGFSSNHGLLDYGVTGDDLLPDF